MPTTNELIEEAKCYLCTGLSQSQAIILALYRRWLLAVNPAADTSLNGLLAYAKCYACHGLSLYQTLMIAMLDQISSGESAESIAVGAIVDSFAERSLITDQTQIDALTTLVTSARANGWWDLCDLIYPWVGGTADSHAQNLKSSNFTITWNGTVTHDANGVTGDGVGGYGDNGYLASSSGQMALNSIHASIYTRVNGSTGRASYGVADGAGNFIYLANGQTTPSQEVGMGANCAGASLAFTAINRVAGTLNLTAMDRYDAINVHGYSSEAAGVYSPLDQSTAQASSALPTLTPFILGYNNVGIGVAVPQDANLAFLTAGSSIGFALFQLMYADIEAFQTSLGRQA